MKHLLWITLLLVSSVALAENGGSGTVGVGNPAAELCEKLKGKSEIFNSARGQLGLCEFGAGQVEEWTLWRNRAGTSQLAIDAFFNPMVRPAWNGGNPASEYCEAAGGTSTLIEHIDGGHDGLCQFSDNSAIEEWTLFRGAKDPTNRLLVKKLKH